MEQMLGSDLKKKEDRNMADETVKWSLLLSTNKSQHIFVRSVYKFGQEAFAVLPRKSGTNNQIVCIQFAFVVFSVCPTSYGLVTSAFSAAYIATVVGRYVFLLLMLNSICCSTPYKLIHTIGCHVNFATSS